MFNKRFDHTIFWAGFVGFLIGILFSFTVWAGNRILQTQALIADDAAVYSASPKKLTLSITEPTDAAISTTGQVSITGTTSAPATVTVFGGSSDATADSSGQFNLTYNLSEGENDLVVAAIDADGHEADTTRTIFYSKEAIQ